MLKSKFRILKVIVSMLCIIMLVTPYCIAEIGEIAAMSISNKKVAYITISKLHEGGNAYKIKDVNVLKLVEVKTSGNSFESEIFCGWGNGSFPTDVNGDPLQIKYNYVGDIKSDSTAISTYKTKYKISDANLKNLISLTELMYLRHQDDQTTKDEFLAKAFADKIASDQENNVIPPTTIDLVKASLSDDVIEVVEQWAMWYFTDDYENSKYHKATLEESFGAMSMSSTGEVGTFNAVPDATRQYAEILYKYLIEQSIANANQTTGTVVTPTLVTGSNTKSVIENEYYKVGPIKLNKGSLQKEDFDTIKLLDQNGNEIDSSKYKIKIEGEEDFTTKNINEIFDQNYYIYIPIKDNKITKLEVTTGYNKHYTEPSLWVPETEKDKSIYQPVIVIERENIRMPLELKFDIEEKEFDLSLRKFIVQYGDKQTDSTRNPNATDNIDVTKLVSGESTTAEYYHAKNPLAVENGDKVIYQINVYNEGSLDGSATQIKDYLPEGLSYVPVNESEINKKYGWVISADGRTATTAYTANTTLKAFNKDTKELSTAYVQIECVVDADVEPGKILTNVAEITADVPTYIDDRDSVPGTINSTTIDSQTYTGNESNKKDLTDAKYFYKGQEDDDDFEKVIVVKNTKYDLALKKFIVKHNSTEITDREPKVSGLNELATNDSVHDAIYTQTKTPLIVEIGDTIVYKIRVYNEGTEDAIASLIYDYLPEGLEFVQDSEINSKYKWKKSSGDNRRYETDYLKDTVIPKFNGTKLEYVDLEMECKVVAEQKSENQKLRNIATIGEDDGDDGDSTPGDITPGTYPDHPLEDDDDYEEIEIPGRAFDLALTKHINSINGKAQDPSREPKVDVSGLRDGSSTTAEYTQVKTPVVAEIGDIIIYTIRVYNEGDIAGYADQVADILPEGLGFLINHKVNVDNYWSIPTNSSSIKLTDIANGTKNLKLSDFEDVTSLENVEVVPGKVKLTSTKLSYNQNDDSNLLKPFDKTNTNSTLDYKDIQVACILMGNGSNTVTFKNIAEVEKDLDKDGKEIADRDSTPGNVETKSEDDDDYELVTLIPKEFDLALRKFITKVDNTDVTTRIPEVAINQEGEIRYVHPKDPVEVANNQLVTYTIRVFNEGEIDGYASEITDNIPEGLVFVPDNDTNKKYGWKLYDADGKETTDVSKAKSIKTDYLSKAKSEARNENCLIKAYDESKGISNDVNNPNPDYRDVQVVFRVSEDTVNPDRIITNIATVTKMHDKDGNPAKDRDEDDLTDIEKVKVKEFDLALKKMVSKVIVIEGNEVNETLTNYTGDEDPKPIVKVEVNRKKLNSTIVKFVYTIRITNEGQIPGYATEIKDYIPEGLEFVQEDNKEWSEISDGVIATNALIKTLLKPGESADVQVTLRWINSVDNLNEKVNWAEISEDYNEYDAKDIDSTPDNQIKEEDDMDFARVFLTISTGAEPVYINLALGILVVIAGGIVVIKKFLM